MSNFAHVTSKLGDVRPETREIARELYDAAQAAGHDIWFMWGMGTSSEHRTGLALDLMVRNKTAGDWIRNYIWTNRKRLRLRHVIWWQRITSTVVRPGVVRKMSDRGNPTANHLDHIHVWFFAGAYQAPQGRPQQSSQATGPWTIVHHMQHALDVVVDGKWGPATDARALRMRSAARTKAGVPKGQNWSFDVEDVQRVINTKVDGVWGSNSQSALENWIRNLQGTMGSLVVDGVWGPRTDSRFLSLRRRHLNNY